MNIKMMLQTIMALVIIVVAVFFLFSPGRIDVEPVTEQEVEWAMDFLRNSLESPRHRFSDFIRERESMVGVTPEWEGRAEMDHMMGPLEYVEYTFFVPHEGLYAIRLTYDATGVSMNPLLLSVLVNDEVQYDEANYIILPMFWQDESKEFPVNRFGDEIAPRRLPLEGPHEVYLFDATFTSDLPLLFHLQAGHNTITIRNETTRYIWMGALDVVSERLPPLYVPPAPGAFKYDGLLFLNSIDYTHKNSSFINLEYRRNVALYPFHPVDQMLNVVNMTRVGNEVFYTIDVPRSGYYAISLHALTMQMDFYTFLTVRVNGVVPFREFLSVPMEPQVGTRWRNRTLSDADGNPFYVFLEAGENDISFRVEISPIAPQITQLRLLIDHVNQFNLQIRRVVGREVDPDRTWTMTRYIPETEYYLEAYHIIFRDIYFQLRNFVYGDTSQATNFVMAAVESMERLREFPNELPLHLDRIVGENNSVLQQAGLTYDVLTTIGLVVNAFHLGRSYDLPREVAPMTERFNAGLVHLWSTFTGEKYEIVRNPDVLTIWTPMNLIMFNVANRLIDEGFREQYGIDLNFIFMPDMGRLLLSYASGTNPDLVIGGGANWDWGARGASWDFATFPGFWEYMYDLVPYGLVGYVYHDQIFGIPENVGFNMMLYRADTLEQLGIDVPETWMDVAHMQAELLRFDMSFFHPLGTGAGEKGIGPFAMHMFQMGGPGTQSVGLLVSPCGRYTHVNQPLGIEAMTFSAELFTVYALHATIPNFFNAFRFNQAPGGLIGLGDYVFLQHFAPELLGQWSIAPIPGTLRPDGTIDRTWIGGSASPFIFSNIEERHALDAWTFLQWWLSADVQTEFAFTLFSNHNIPHIPSNWEAIEQTPMDQRHLRVAMDSLSWMRGLPAWPGGYMLQRYLSFAWNGMVFEGEQPQLAIDTRVPMVNREFQRRQIDFGITDANGNRLREFEVRDVDWVLEQIAVANAWRYE